MPMLRRDDAPDPIGPTLLYLWDKKWWILGPGLGIAILTFIILRVVPEEYKVSAEIYVNRLAMGNREQEEVPSPGTVGRLLESASLIAAVRQDYQEAFDLEKVPKLERFAKAFKVKTDVLQDTSIRKDVMPVIGLTVQSRGTSETRFLMESWLKHIIAQYGDYATREAIQKRDALLLESTALQADLRAAEEVDTRIRSELVFQGKVLGQLMDRLAPADASGRTATSPDRLTLDPQNSTNLRVTVNSPQPKPPGLMARLADLNLELTRAAAGAPTSPTVEIKREIRVVSSLVQDTETSITNLQQTVARLEGELSSKNREVVLKTRMLQELHEALNRFTVLAAVQEHRSDDSLVGSDLQVLSRPVVPEEKAWPKRTLSAGLAGLATMIMAIIGLLVYRYLSGLAGRSTTRETAGLP